MPIPPSALRWTPLPAAKSVLDHDRLLAAVFVAAIDRGIHVARRQLAELLRHERLSVLIGVIVRRARAICAQGGNRALWNDDADFGRIAADQRSVHVRCSGSGGEYSKERCGKETHDRLLSPVVIAKTGESLNRKAFAAAAGASRVRVFEDEPRREVVLSPVHDGPDEIQYRRAIDIEC